MPEIKKILVIRFSSIGDIVLTTPALRALDRKFPNAQIHFVTKKQYESLVSDLPALDKIHFYEGDLTALVKELKKEKFDLVIDLHRSIRSLFLRIRLGTKSFVVRKYRFREFKFLRIGMKDTKFKHTVERYLETIAPLDCIPDSIGLDFILSPELIENAKKEINAKFPIQPIAIVLGAGRNTKKWLPEYFSELINRLGEPVLLFGGKGESAFAKKIESGIKVPFLDLTNREKLKESAALMQQCKYVITHDTGFMHIASALKMKIFSLWGNTVPDFGFSPYKADSVILEVKGLSCRPCSKIGFDECPKGHFNCMRDLKPETIEKEIRRNI